MGEVGEFAKQDNDDKRAMELLQESSMTAVWNTLEDEVWNDVPSRENDHEVD